MKRQGAVSAYAFVQFTDIRSVVKVLKEMEGEVWGSMKLKVGIIDPWGWEGGGGSMKIKVGVGMGFSR